MKAIRTKIAFVSDAVYPFNKGGKETRIFHLTTQLAMLGYDVHIYTMQWWVGSNDYIYEGVTYHAISRFHQLYAGDRRSIKQGVLFGLACLKLVSYDFDILDVDHMPFIPLYSVKLVSILKRRPLFATWHEVWGKRYWQEYLGNFLGLIAYYIEKFSIFLPDHIIAVSSHTEQRLIDMLHYKGPLSVITNGIDYKNILPIPPAKQSSDVIYTGRLLAHKNVDLLIEAIALLRTRQPDIRCLIIGDGPERQRLEQLIQRKKLGKNVIMTGFLESPDNVFAYMKASKVFVLPSRREGFGITVLEAYACGLSIVTVSHPDNAAQYIAPKDASLVCDLTSKAIANSISTQLAKHTVAINRSGDRYDWRTLALSLKAVYAP